MEWQEFLEKTEPTGLTARQKKLAKEIADGDNEDHKQLWSKEASWESWLDKDDRWDKEPQQTKGHGITSPKKTRAISTHRNEEGKRGDNFNDDNELTLDMNDRATREGLDTQYVNHSPEPKFTLKQPKFRKGVANQNYPKSEQPEQDEMNIELAHESKSWESWLDKNNGIETSHKEGEKKEEWDGKFSSSTIRDDAKDEKSESEEESLEELTDGKLEEIEKLKSWEVFLKKFGGVESDVSPEPSENIDMTGKNPTKRKRGRGVGTPQTVNGKTVPREIAQKPSGNVITPKVGTFQDTKNTKNLTENDVDASAVRVAKKDPKLRQFVPEAQVEEDKGLGGDTNKPVKTQEELDKEFYERTQPEPKGTKSHKKVIARRTRKSWELFLEKGITYRDPNNKETDPKKIRENALIASEKPVIKSWSEWLEKMQGAGDARFGNQHLTGMEQHPVADDDSLELSPETEENNEKEDKKEDKEDKDNKPYKALR